MINTKADDDLVVIHQQIGSNKITDVLTREFMEKYTNFHSFKELTFSSLVWIDWSKDPVITKESSLNRFIAGSSRFKTWKEMFDKALEEYNAKNPSGCGCHHQ